MDLNSFLSVNVMISCYVLSLWVLNMRVKFHSFGFPHSPSLEMEIRIYLLLALNRATFEAIFAFDAEVNWKSKTRYTYFMT